MEMIIGVVAVTSIVALTALISGMRVRSTRDFTIAGRKAGWPIVSGIIVGALVGGSSTVGTTISNLPSSSRAVISGWRT